MSNEQRLQVILSSLQDTLKLQAALMAKSEEREARLQASFDQRMRTLHSEVAQVHHKIDDIVAGASARIAQETKDAMALVAVRYSRDVSVTSAHLRKASRTIWAWFCAAGSILLLVLLVGWAVLGYYRRELATAKDELGRYEDAIPVLKAYYASDASICGERICVNVDSNAQRQGDKKQYSRARPRP